MILLNISFRIFNLLKQNLMIQRIHKNNLLLLVLKII